MNEIEDFLNNVFSIVFTENISNLEAMRLHALSEYNSIGRGALLANVQPIYDAYKNKAQIDFGVPTCYLPASEISLKDREQSFILKKYLYAYCPSEDFIFIAYIPVETGGTFFKAYLFQSVETHKLQEATSETN